MDIFKFINQKVNIAAVTTLLKTVLIGVLVGEVWFLSMEMASNLYVFITVGNHQIWELWLGFWGGLLASIFTVIYLFVRGCVADGVKILRSLRIDLFVMFIGGVLISLSLGGIGTLFYTSVMSKLNSLIVIFILVTPIAVGVALIARAFQIKLSKKEEEKPFFISDIEGNDKEKDLLDYASSATKFADRVCNGDSKASMVFGIDAPWGIGKSTFVNYCIRTWEEKRYADKVAVL